MAINFIPSTDSKETRTMHTKSDNIEIVMDSKTDDSINELLDLFYEIIQRDLKNQSEEARIFDSVDLLYYHLQRISLKRSESHINSPKWPKNKKVTINPKSKNNCCFKHSIVGADHWEEIDNLPERTSNLKKK